MANPPLIFFAGGGTGGHLYPGIAIAQALAEILPTAQPLFLCTNREIDRTILTPTGFAFEKQPIVPPRRTISGLLKFWQSWRETKSQIERLLAGRRPTAVLGLGGYAAGVAVKLAARAGIPTALLNPDVVPGRANQYLMPRVRAVCCQFDATADHVPPTQRPKLHTTGCPIRRDLTTLPLRQDAATRLSLDPNLQTLTITGASQGAATVNEALLESLPSLRLSGWQILHLAGIDHAAAVRRAYETANASNSIPVRVIDFTPAMQNVWAVTDLAICRSGASTVAELTNAGIPSILMPYPYHRDMHQRENARVLKKAGAAVLLDDAKDKRLNAASLIPVLQPLLDNPARRAAMSKSALSLARPDAAVAVARILASFVTER